MASQVIVNGRTPRQAAPQVDSMAGVGQLLTGMPIVMQAPQVEVEAPVLEERKSLWRSLLSKINDDPNVKMALMSTAIGLMRNPGFGQNSWDVAANALAQGLGTFQQGRQLDRQNQQAERKLGLEEELGRGQLGVSQQNAQTYAEATTTQGEVARGNLANDQTRTAIQQLQANLEADLAPRRVAADEKRAEADLIRANAYRTTAGSSGSTGQNVQLVNARKEALMKLNPGMTEEEATLQAQNDILLTAKTGNNPAGLAASLFKSNLAAWSNSFENLGKAPTPEQLEELKQLSAAQAQEFMKLNKTPGADAIGRIGQLIDQTMPVPQGEPTPEEYVGRKVELQGGAIAEIVNVSGDQVTLRMPNGRTGTAKLEVVAPNIIAE